MLKGCSQVRSPRIETDAALATRGEARLPVLRTRANVYRLLNVIYESILRDFGWRGRQ
jgi:hypothetical protein